MCHDSMDQQKKEKLILASHVKKVRNLDLIIGIKQRHMSYIINWLCLSSFSVVFGPK